MVSYFETLEISALNFYDTWIFSVQILPLEKTRQIGSSQIYRSGILNDNFFRPYFEVFKAIK